ncbi:MAG TPA: low temperature requirement protein A [Chitinophagaceae bacterium]|nr:low temperature requirement protein A [Chitinophagaceae bacterium]
MPHGKGLPAWWGPPKKFDTFIEDRRVSWLELFFDLVYVIAISRITHQLTAHISVAGFLEYVCLFFLIFWGWLNGSLYYDLHGNEGLRTRLMTLWQMMIIAALAVTLGHLQGTRYVNTTIVLMIMQLFITYQWWSVGFYDKRHRYYSRPYIILFLVSLALMGLSLVMSQQWLKMIVPLVLLCNYSPPFIAGKLLRRSAIGLNLSSSMYERLGLFTIIIFGEVVSGVVNGISSVTATDMISWLNFALAVVIVFALWWVFFTLTANRQAKKGFVNATLLELVYIPALISLGLTAACFNLLFEANEEAHSLPAFFGYALAAYFASISIMMGLIEYPAIVNKIMGRVRISLYATALVFFVFTLINARLDILYYLLVVIAVIIIEILYLNSLYYSLPVEKKAEH